jgi:hypothetical protein
LCTSSRPPAKVTTATNSTISPITTNRPSMAGWDLRWAALMVGSPAQELAHRLGAVRQQCAWRIECGHRLLLGIQEQGAVGHGKDAVEFMGHHHDGGAQVVAQAEDELVQPRGGEGVQPGRWLVQVEQGASRAMARAMAARFFMPPESAAGEASKAPSSPPGPA